MGRPHASQGPLLDVDELAERLNISVRHVRRLVAERRVPYLKVGHLVRFEPAAIDAWLQGLIACPAPCLTRENAGQGGGARWNRTIDLSIISAAL